MYVGSPVALRQGGQEMLYLWDGGFHAGNWHTVGGVVVRREGRVKLSN